MNGGGFTPGEQSDTRVKGVNPICSNWIQSLTDGQKVTLTTGPHKLSALNTYVGAFVKISEDVVTHYTIDLKDPTSNQLIKGVIQKNNKKNMVDFDASMEDQYIDRYVSCVGFVQDHLDHGKCFNIVNMKLVTNGSHLISYLLSLDRQIKSWNQNAPSGGAGDNNSMFGNNNAVKNEKGGESLLDKVLNYIKNAGNTSSWGCSRTDVYNSLNMDKAKIDNAIMELIDEGQIFNTVDDSHFQAS